MLEPGRNCWRIERADRAALIVDAANYYRHALHAMLEARSQILLIGWDVDTRIRLVDEDPPEGAPATLGAFLSWIAKRRPDLHIHILAWDQGAISVPGRGTTFFRMLRWGFDRQISVKWDHQHPLDGSHHQKILVIDDKLAFCGGIDITGSRWDTRHHKDEEPGRRRPFTGRAYEPWHDAIMAVDGCAADAIGDLARIRWACATGTHLPAPPRGDHEPWPDSLDPHFRDVEIGIARTRAKAGDIDEIREIEALFVDLIERAERFVYVETQYFASRVIAEAIGRRLAAPDGPEFVIVNPRTAYGWLDERVMSPARYHLVKALEEKDAGGRFAIYYPVTEGGADIYVHAKIMIVDDCVLRVGSANMNNRSMGLDSECDLLIDARDDAAARQTIADIRTDLLAEHFGTDPDTVARCFGETRSLIACIEAMRGEGRTLVPLEPEEPSEAAKALAQSELLDPEAADELFEKRARPGLLSRLRRARPGGGTGAAGPSLSKRNIAPRRTNMSRIPSKAMPHAYAPEGGGAEDGGEGEKGNGASLAERASELAGKVRGSRAAKVAAGAMVAGAAVAAATAVVRSRRGKAAGGSGKPASKSGTAKTSGAKSSSAGKSAAKSGTAAKRSSGGRKSTAKSGGKTGGA